MDVTLVKSRIFNISKHFARGTANFWTKNVFFQTFWKKTCSFGAFFCFAKVVLDLFFENIMFLGVFWTFWEIWRCDFFIFVPSDIPGKWKFYRFLRRGSFRKAQIPGLFGGGFENFHLDTGDLVCFFGKLRSVWVGSSNCKIYFQV